MLTLTRGCGESIHIAKNIVVKVIKVRGKKVCIGIDAPSAFRVLNEELLPTHGPLKDACIVEPSPAANGDVEKGHE